MKIDVELLKHSVYVHVYVCVYPEDKITRLNHLEVHTVNNLEVHTVNHLGVNMVNNLEVQRKLGME